jgi:hypothetical protein
VQLQLPMRGSNLFLASSLGTSAWAWSFFSKVWSSRSIKLCKPGNWLWQQVGIPLCMGILLGIILFGKLVTRFLSPQFGVNLSHLQLLMKVVGEILALKTFIKKWKKSCICIALWPISSSVSCTVTGFESRFLSSYLIIIFKPERLRRLKFNESVPTPPLIVQCKNIYWKWKCATMGHCIILSNPHCAE